MPLSALTSVCSHSVRHFVSIISLLNGAPLHLTLKGMQDIVFRRNIWMIGKLVVTLQLRERCPPSIVPIGCRATETGSGSATSNLTGYHSLYSKHQNGATPERRRRDTLSATL